MLADPDRLLMSARIGATFTALLAAGFGAVGFADRLTPILLRVGLRAGVAGTFAVLAVTLVIACIWLVVGRLAPKLLALARSERIGDDEAGTGEELRHAVATNDTLSPDERRLLTDILESGNRPMREIMTPRLDVLPTALRVADAIAAVQDQPHSHYPVVESSLDDVVGFVHVRDLMGLPAADPRTMAELGVGDSAGHRDVVITVWRMRGNRIDAVRLARAAPVHGD